ncbi:MAG: lipopolysaccharide export system permease protein [Parvibaculaceae bacterium]|jgi:lipopolysaccharide export system permease protein|nr:LPS export ABC transporter permease LptG [Parvibaculaceae bacterium]
MNFSWTLSRYFGYQFLKMSFGAFAVCTVVIFLADFVELLRRTSDNQSISFLDVLTMTSLRMPSLGAEVLPFAVLIGAMAALLRLNRSSELVVARAAGVSAWQFLAPIFVLAFILGTFVTTVYNPVAARMISRFEVMEAKHIKGRASILSLSQSGLWLGEANQEGRKVVHALRGSQTDAGIELQDVIVFQYGPSDEFLGRIDAEKASLDKGFWLLTNAWITGIEPPTSYEKEYQLKTNLQPTQVQESFASPKTISFWDLPRFIETAEKAGFSAVRHRIYWHSLISNPVLFATMVLIAAAFTMRTSRMGGLNQLIIGAVISGFLFFFLTKLSLALGNSGSVPPFLAAWAPAGVALLLGLSALFYLEDG